MKNFLKRIHFCALSLLAAAAITLTACVPNASADTNVVAPVATLSVEALPVVDATAPVVTELPGWLVSLVEKFPWLVTVLVIVGALHMLVPLTFNIWLKKVQATADTKDDETYTKVVNHKATQMVLKVLRYAAGLKLPAKPVAQPTSK